MKVLIVEDDPDVMETIADYLMLKGYIVDCAYHGLGAIEAVKVQNFDAIIMDIMMPKMDGIKATSHLRQQQNINTPILFLTARDSLQDKKAAYLAGGDDYLVKPFALEELSLRLQALSKRGQLSSQQTLAVGDLIYNLQTNALVRAGNDIKLSKIQQQMIVLLMQKYPSHITRLQLTEHIWGEEEPDSDALRSHIYTLRKSLNAHSTHNILATVHGRGFKLVSET